MAFFVYFCVLLGVIGTVVDFIEPVLQALLESKNQNTFSCIFLFTSTKHVKNRKIQRTLRLATLKTQDINRVLLTKRNNMNSSISILPQIKATAVNRNTNVTVHISPCLAVTTTTPLYASLPVRSHLYRNHRRLPPYYRPSSLFEKGNQLVRYYSSRSPINRGIGARVKFHPNNKLTINSDYNNFHNSYFHTSAPIQNKGKGKATNTDNSINSNDTQLNTPVLRDGLRPMFGVRGLESGLPQFYIRAILEGEIRSTPITFEEFTERYNL